MGLTWFGKRKLRRMLKGVRQIEIDEVNSFMGKVYNPQNVVSKPKYRQKETVEDVEMTRRYIHMIYDPPLRASYRRDHTLNEYMEAKT
ncbi:hypothetical protein C0585_05375 [Candidatus Woesearchaeota archaeon]|nr:MAG: hypothetical protein C0585_05375 [Candidatus Woesearchaeota archaeon]